LGLIFFFLFSSPQIIFSSYILLYFVVWKCKCNQMWLYGQALRRYGTKSFHWYSPEDQFKAQAKELLFVRPSSSPFLSFVSIPGRRKTSLPCLPSSCAPPGPPLLPEIYLIVRTFSFLKQKFLVLFSTKMALTVIL